MDQTLSLGFFSLTLQDFVVYGVCFLGLLMCCLVWFVWRGAQWRRYQAQAEAYRVQELEHRLDQLLQVQSETSGRMQTMAEIFGARQSDLARGLSERMEGVGHRLGQNLQASSKTTFDTLGKLNERLAVIDNAQAVMRDLSGQVDDLRHILANKQTRGAFGQGRMEAILQDGLPRNGYVFQATLSTGTRPDALIFMPNNTPPLVVDAKFPLEAFSLLEAAEDEMSLKAAHMQVRRDMGKHVQDIHTRYLLSGETQDTALMFVPSESLFAILHEQFDDVVQKALRARVILVGPSLLMLAVQVMQAILRDVRMRAEAGRIQQEVHAMMDDVGRLRERVAKLQGHFAQVNRDVDQILISSDKITKRGHAIETLDFQSTDPGRTG